MANKITEQNIMAELGNPENWKKTRKKNYDIYVCKPEVGSVIVNKLEGTTYVTDRYRQFVLSGTIGEQWIADFETLNKSYCFIDGTPLSIDKIKNRMDTNGNIEWTHIKTLLSNNIQYWAFHVPMNIRNFPVQTANGNVMYANRTGVKHGAGDFIVCGDLNGQPNLSNVWVVNGCVFYTTYDMRAFPGLAEDVRRSVPASTVIPTMMPKKAKESDKDKIKKFVYAVGSLVNKNDKVTGLNLVHDTENGNLQDYDGYDLWTITFNDYMVVISFENGKYRKDSIKISIKDNNEELLVDTLIQSPNQAYEYIEKAINRKKETKPASESRPEAKGSDTRGAKRVMYQIVGRYMNGKEAVAYALQSIDKDKQAKFTREQVCYLVGRGQVTNCEAQLYNGKVLLRGKGINFDNLPTKQLDGEFKHTEAIGKIRKDTSVDDAMHQFMIVNSIKNGKEVTHYVIRNAGNATKTVTKEELFELVRQGRVGNARIQMYNGKELLRGVGTDLSKNRVIEEARRLEC